MSSEFYLCPRCGGEVRVGSRSCPKCDPPKPWEQDEAYDGLDLPRDGGDTFDYDEFVADEFGGGRRPRGRALLWAITAIIVLLALALRRFFF